MIKIRLMGLPEDLDAMLTQLARVVELLEVSPTHQNRGTSQLVRQYVTVRVMAPTFTPTRKDPHAE
jgi:hypothetical protein